MDKPCDFTILSGFLGSGKTTLLSTYLADADPGSTAVIVNDVGEVNIDGAILATHDGVPMATLSNGCVCCSLTNDLPYTIEALLHERQVSAREPYRRIVLECSGLSDPGAVLRSLSPLAHLAMRVSVVTTVAADRPLPAEEFPLLAQQVCAAHTVVLTRTDLATERQVSEMAENTHAIGPAARIVIQSDPRLRAQEALEPAEYLERPYAGLDAMASPHPRIQVFSLQWPTTLGWSHFSGWLENLAFYFDSRLLRTKGLVHVEGDTLLLIQGVGQHFDVPRRIGGPNAGDSRLVVICRDASYEEIMALEPTIPGLTVVTRTTDRPGITLARPQPR